ncbi:hypothetical protein MXB_3390 [Myxobolus squamalis]|nr:hypothetical protein MXB_3390 [Myxobolus squamalis]
MDQNQAKRPGSTKTMFDGYFGPLPERQVSLSLTDVHRITQGTFGVVYKANLFVYPKNRDQDARAISVFPQTPEIVAFKLVLQDSRFKNRELPIMRALTHSNVIGLKYYFRIEHQGAFYLGLVMEFLPINLYTHIRESRANGKLLDEKTVKSFAYQLLSAINYIHKLDICHRDIKPQNILLCENRKILKVCDFGSAKKLNATERNVAYICSRHYRAPELILGSERYTTAVDVWSCGCVLVESVTTHTLFLGNSSLEQFPKIISVLGMPDRSYFTRFSFDFRSLDLRNVVPKTLKNVFFSQIIPRS